MFKIGDFSKIALVSIKTLRHYDRVGLLNPAHIDPMTSYRYYTLEQLPRLNQILALKGLGLSLDQVKKLLDDNITAEEIRGMLKLKQAQIEQVLEEEQVRLFRVAQCLSYLDDAGNMPPQDVALKAVPDQHVLAIREPAPEMSNWGTLIGAAYKALRGLNLAGRPFALFHGEEYNHDMVDWELNFGIEAPDVDPVTLDHNRVLRPAHVHGHPQMATLIHRGPYVTLSHGYAQLGEWILRNGFQIAGNGREVYLQVERPAEAVQPVTELQFPVQATV